MRPVEEINLAGPRWLSLHSRELVGDEAGHHHGTGVVIDDTGRLHRKGSVSNMKFSTFWYCSETGIINICKYFVLLGFPWRRFLRRIFLFCLFFAIVANVQKNVTEWPVR